MHVGNQKKKRNLVGNSMPLPFLFTLYLPRTETYAGYINAEIRHPKPTYQYN